MPLRLRGGIAAVIEDSRIIGTVALRSIEQAAEQSRVGALANAN